LNTEYNILPVTINRRYVSGLRRIKEDEKINLYVGLAFCSWAVKVPQLRENASVIKWKFGNLRGENSEPPYVLFFENLQELLKLLKQSELVYKCWSEVLLTEVNRAKSSPYRKSHEPLMYKMAVDINFRTKILDMVYPESNQLPEQIDNPHDFYEGVSKSITVNEYERNPQARNACIEHYGAKCLVCGMTFQEKYGDIGNGFIQVHHLKPLNEIDAEYKVDPIKDLCPICPNCHAMLHRRKQPYSINELKSMIQE